MAIIGFEVVDERAKSLLSIIANKYDIKVEQQIDLEDHQIEGIIDFIAKEKWETVLFLKSRSKDFHLFAQDIEQELNNWVYKAKPSRFHCFLEELSQAFFKKEAGLQTVFCRYLVWY